MRVTALESRVFLNRGDHFESRVLPAEAQWAPAFGVSVADFNGDGFEDVFLSQNFFAVPPDESRLDAGRGLLLRGDGRGGFAPLSGAESGIEVYGEQRGSAVADLDHDGRPDSYGIELELANLAATPIDATASITVQAADGDELTFDAQRAPGCLAEGTVYCDGPDEDGLRAAALGDFPFTYEVEVVLDGTRHTATAAFPDDVIEGNEPSVALDFEPPLPALG